ncbi:hypothetical protein [Glycomyces salinus]|uniref:hypothetical protein n=1 Tax=Glycomyces salinus TaxID=980294 RepID=UPI0018ED7A08|nr:hypothetical protein [Glycomyces salinus]
MTVERERVVLAGGWTSLMLIYLLGDVLRVFAGHFEPGRMGGEPVPEWMWTLAAGIMMVPIAMIMTSLLAAARPLSWITMGTSAALAAFNLSGLPYQGFFDDMLIVLSVGMNALIAWLAWSWKTGAASA